jgi:glyoxylase-like metal-dependent hydrolase (beta-lactamase superfamily II)
MAAPEVKTFFDPDTYTCTHLVIDGRSARCAIIDPVLDYAPNSGRTSTRSADRVIDAVRGEQLTVEWILETHVHADHLSAAPYLQAELGGRIGIGFNVTRIQQTFGEVFNAGPGFATDGSQFDVLLGENEAFEVGAIGARALYTPGHTPACMSYLIGDALFIGDTLFMPDYGTARCDFPGGDAAQLYRSIQKLFSLPDETRMFMCHDYLPKGRDEYAWETTVGEQRRDNIHVHEGVGEAEFVAMRTGRDQMLDMPRLILPSVQVNMRGGRLPEPESNGTRYLKLPLDAF